MNDMDDDDDDDQSRPTKIYSPASQGPRNIFILKLVAALSPS